MNSSRKPNKGAAGNSRCPCQLRLIYEICLSSFHSTSRSAAVPELGSLGGANMFNRISNAVAAICIVNWMAWGVISIFIGGTAWHGKVEGGKYFFLNHSHYVQVSPSVFEYSRIHGYFAFAGLGLFFVVAVTKLLVERFRHEIRAA
jgi:hypothetical protein